MNKKILQSVILFNILFTFISNSVHAVVVIGVAGGTRSGKSTFASHLHAAIVGENLGKVAPISMDMYYNPREQDERYFEEYTYLGKRDVYFNFDHPSALDWDLLKKHLQAIIEGKPVRPPTYYFGTGGMRELESGAPIENPDFVILEGLWALNPEVSQFLDLKIFIETPSEVRFQRNLDIAAERKSNRAEVEEYTPIAEEGYNQYIAPTASGALIISGEVSPELSVSKALAVIKKFRN